MVSKVSLYVKSLNKLKNIKYLSFAVIILTGLVLWVFRILSLFGLFENPHGRTPIWFVDFQVYYEAAKSYLESGKIYGEGYYYPPPSIIFFLPFSSLSFETASHIFTIINLVFLSFCVVLLLRIIQKYLNLDLPKSEKLLLGLVFFFHYSTSTTITHGQVNILLTFLVLISFYLIFIKPIISLSSITITIVAIFKVWPLVLSTLHFFNTKAKNIFIRTLIISASVFLISLHFFGIYTWKIFTENLFEFMKIKIKESFVELKDPLDCNASIYNLLYKLGVIFGLQLDTMIFTLKAVLLLVSLLLLIKGKKLSKNIKEWDIFSFNLLTTTIFAISNVFWLYYFVFILPFLIFFIYYFEHRKTESTMLLLVVILTSLQEYVVYGAKLIGGYVAFLVYLLPPTCLAFFIYFLFSIYTTAKLVRR